MLLKHFFVSKIAHSSYILAGKNYCAIIDPERDVDVYISEARAMGGKTIGLICSSGNRSTLGASVLKQHGFKDVYNGAGGLSGYSAAGNIRECKVCVNPHGSRFFTTISEVKKH